MTVIIGIKLDNRIETAPEFQSILTQAGCQIKTRLGLHDVDEKGCVMSGIILLEIPNEEAANDLKERLTAIKNIKIETMKF